jgi:hypothetical protein
MEWYRQVQFVAAVPMPPEVAEAFGTTVNGMWADPERRTAGEVDKAHRDGQRVLFSVPMIALTPNTYESEAAAHLLEEVCRDVDGGSSECDWYYWESKPVYAGCIYSDAFRGYLMDRCREGVDRGTDVVNLDEIMTGIGLMNRKPGGSGFCTRCLARFRAHVHGLPVDDDDLRAALKTDDDLYERYRHFHEDEAFRVMTAFIRELRAYADERNPGFAISANMAYLGTSVPTFGALWGCSWGRHLDFVMLENHYRVEHGSPHLVLPRGTFAPWYRLGSSFKGSPTWMCPSITVPRQMEGQPRTTYHELMFLEAYANRGRWGYYWWPGVDVQTRLAATAPDVLKDHIRFIRDHRELYEDAVPNNELAILYADDAIAARPESHDNYVALAQALAERSVQFDVVYVGDGRFNPDGLDPETIARYRAILVPEARCLGPAPAATLEAFARAGGEVTVYSESPLDPELVRALDGQMLSDFWRHYRDEDRDRILASVSAPPSAGIESSDPAVVATRYALGDRQVLHLLNYRYDEGSDEVTPAGDIRLRIPWDRGPATATLFDLEGDREMMAMNEDGTLVVEIPELAIHGVLVIAAVRPEGDDPGRGPSRRSVGPLIRPL